MSEGRWLQDSGFFLIVDVEGRSKEVKKRVWLLMTTICRTSHQSRLLLEDSVIFSGTQWLTSVPGVIGVVTSSIMRAEDFIEQMIAPEEEKVRWLT